jgi:hypothetical protein
MRELPEPFTDLPGERLPLDDYQADFQRREETAAGCDSWKLERRQYFYEKGDPSREALRRGDWSAALRLLEDEREDLLRVARDDRRRGSVFHRVRVVEEPPTPYLQWELYALRLQAECGLPVRVVPASAVAAAERVGPLPELVVLGGRTLYHVDYTDDGVLSGAVRYDDPGAVERWTDFLAGLYADGEDVRAYVDRYVVGLPPPDPTGR